MVPKTNTDKPNISLDSVLIETWRIQKPIGNKETLTVQSPTKFPKLWKERLKPF